jgi:gliding motility-associated-like protein
MVSLFFCGPAAKAQQPWSQQTACPGWNNPASFSVGGTVVDKWSGQGINITSGNKPCPNPLSGATGVSSMDGTIKQGGQLATVNTGSCSNSITSPANQFVIMDNLTSFDPNTGNHLRYVPTHFNTYDTTPGAINTNLTRSIRIGDGCYNGGATGGNSGAALYYTMKVTPNNAMLYLYYAIVAEAPGHNQDGNPTFIIRVMKKNNAGAWTQISDTLAYYISSTIGSCSQSGNTCPNMSNVTLAGATESGWHWQGTPCGYSSVLYKDWDKACINLSNYLYDTLRIEVIIYDCIYNAHYAYGYIAGECRQMKLLTSGCPAGMSTDVTTLTAPRDMRNYVWYASQYGYFDEISHSDYTPGGERDYVTWEPLTSETVANPNGYNYNVTARDFRVTRRRVNGYPTTIDSVGNKQTFRCKMTSAIDPDKPFESYLYVGVQNTKPTMEVDSLLLCNGKAKMWNRSYVPGDPSLVVYDSTRWAFHDNPNCSGNPVAEFRGDSAEYQYEGLDPRGVHVWTYTRPNDQGEVCYSENKYVLRPRQNPNTRMAITKKILCDADETTLSDITDDYEHNTRFWIFRDSTAAEEDLTSLDTLWGSGENNRVVTRSFTHGVEPIDLWVRNGLFYLNPRNARDTIWCEARAQDTVSVFQHPMLERDGDSIVCQGEKTKIWVRAMGVEGECTYQWSTTYGEVTGDFPPGDTLRVTPYADTSVYYVKVTSPAPAFCEAWDSAYAYLVSPKLKMIPTDGRICPGDIARLIGTNADHYSWTASPDDPSLAGQEDNDTILVTPEETTVYTLVGHGTNDCDATPITGTVTIVPLPEAEVALTPELIDAENPKVTLRDISNYGVASSWLFNDGSTAEGREVTHVFEHSVGMDSVPVTLTSYNVLNCPTVYPFNIPVSTFTAWFPTVFTPGSNDANSTFSLFTINEYQYFHIYIYNRRGELIYESDDVNFSWDGTYKGEPCSQGTYVYTCRYRKPGTINLNTITGTITLIR